MAKRKFDSKDDFETWATEIEKELAELKAAFEKMRKEIENIENAKSNQDKKGAGFWD